MTHIQQRRDSAGIWASTNPVLYLGELGWETDTLGAKLGNGIQAWNDLDYAIPPSVVTSVNGQTGIVLLTKDDIGLGSADDTSDMDKPVSIAQQAALDLKADKNSPVLTGVPTAPTAVVATNNNQIATTKYVKDQGYAALASPVFTGNPTGPTPATADNDTSLATTAFVKAQGYAPLASPALTGNPTAPTPSASDNDTSIATTAFVKTAVAPTPSWITPTLQNGWLPFGAPYPTRYAVVNGVVYISAMIKSGTTANGTILFNMGASYRPSVQQPPIPVATGAMTDAAVVVWTNGDVTISFGGNATYMALAFSYLLG
jgi:hypothetical protein